MTRLHIMVVILISLGASLDPAMPDEPERPARPNVKLREWEKGIAVDSLDEPGMSVYLWFYEWNMFEARARGQHTGGTYEWKRTVSEDGRTALIDAGDMQLDIRAEHDGAKLTLDITNRTEHAWPEIAGIIPCFNPGAPRGREDRYPLAVRNAEFENTNTWYVGAGGLEKLVGRAIHFNDRLRPLVDEEADNGQFAFSHKWPTAPDNAHAGLIVRESTGGEWVTGIAWEKFLSAQGHNPWSCMHLCINVGPLAPGESTTVDGRVYLFRGSRDDCLGRYRNDFADSET